MSQQNPSKSRKRGLGRGLEAILQSPDTDITSQDISGNYVAGAIAEIELEKIEANPFQPRSDFDDMGLRELATSIQTQGVIQPVTVRKLGFDKYQLISGERRLRASKIAGLEKVPVFIRVANDEQMLEMALIENIHRKNLNALEIAISYQRLIDECQLTQEQLSERVGKNRTTITNFLRLLKLPAEVQVALRDGHISMGHARALINLQDDKQQLLLLQQMIDHELNVRQVEAMVRKIQLPAEKKKTEKMNIVPALYKSQLDSLSKQLDTKLDIRRNAQGKGSITIRFNNDIELERLFSTLINPKS
ncbi:MAG: ParB/RepB/Spo0J family partition protein [Bacteroidales bacterium]|nr:ParB/RepB/Spo0J family partition protein [Bacteroidales bacterium]MCK9449291.1 ParB/RepB/Spo0J family partition protein [Bacteroidales bacterium]MDD3700260.1 ParB/RepB/Spo0J family partition protein [Bacteroidales bacterium]MDY0368490.1 ParB/RepB/Spo0J family partition protein [Bacteroidales bacterium]